MAKSAKRSLAQKGAVIAPALLAKALEALKDPQNQALIREHGSAVVDAARRTGASVADGIGERFGQRGLERRAANLREAVTELSTKSPSLATSLRPLTESLDDVGQMLTASAALPFAKRKKAHMRIDNVLDPLEKGLFDTTFGGAHPDRTS